MGDINSYGETLSRVTYGFIITGDGERAMRSLDRTLRKERVDIVLKAEWIQAVRMYTERRQAMVDHWVGLRPTFEVCAQQEID